MFWRVFVLGQHPSAGPGQPCWHRTEEAVTGGSCGCLASSRRFSGDHRLNGV